MVDFNWWIVRAIGCPLLKLPFKRVKVFSVLKFIPDFYTRKSSIVYYYYGGQLNNNFSLFLSFSLSYTHTHSLSLSLSLSLSIIFVKLFGRHTLILRNISNFRQSTIPYYVNIIPFYLFNVLEKWWTINVVWCVLCILTSKRGLRTPFAGQNLFFDAKTTFYVYFSHKMYKMMQKITKKTYYKVGCTSF